MKKLSLLIAMFFIFGFTQDGNQLPFKKGEKLSYRLHYGLVDAGVATIELSTKKYTVNGEPAYRAIGLGKTKTFFDLFFRVRDRYESYFSPSNLEALKFVRRIDEGGYKKEQDYIFYPTDNKVDIGEGKKMDLPKRGMQDMISAFYYIRTLDLSSAKQGDEFEVPMFIDEEYFPMRIKFSEREIIKTDLGKIACLKFKPLVQKGRIFKEDEDVTVWVSDDANKIPVRAQADVLVGSIKLDLTDCKNLVTPLKIQKR